MKKKRRNPAINRSLRWACPYFKWDGLTEVNGECGKVKLPDKDTAVAFMKTHCAGRWERCSLARAINEYYDRRTDNDTEENRQNKGPGGPDPRTD